MVKSDISPVSRDKTNTAALPHPPVTARRCITVPRTAPNLQTKLMAIGCDKSAILMRDKNDKRETLMGDEIKSIKSQLKALNFHGLNQFLRMACLARQTITFQQVNNWRPPPAILPPAILQTISTSLNVSETSLVQTCWAASEDILWDHPVITPSDEDIITYNDAALENGTTYSHIYPLVRVCSNPECTNHRNTNDIMTLMGPLTHKVTLYMLQSGVLQWPLTAVQPWIGVNFIFWILPESGRHQNVIETWDLGLKPALKLDTTKSD
ncbi:hypothetical protein B0H17DRAFT_1134408 [Mycena rosella]|uniref:Uncharacterized protein n=1 Tax=Mycena rosella TaxID=1033263 RepID=A0AAD7DFY9_MYCRO|nr:hypothetical protein B0H17DRAFT_1134408 [Mycena rosella]